MTISPIPEAGRRSEHARLATALQLILSEPAPGVRLISVGGVLGPDGSARLFRLLDSQLQLNNSGRRRLDIVLCDVSSLRALEDAGAVALADARHACRRRGIDFALTGGSGGLFSAPLPTRSRLRGLAIFPTVDTALDALAGTERGQSATIHK